MIANDLITNDIIPLRTSDSGEEALSIMHEFFVQHLPIVNDQELLGLVSEDDILDHDAREAVGSYSLSVAHIRASYTDHLYELMRLVAQYDLTAIPIVDANGHYQGLITSSDLLNYYARTASFSERGSIIILEMQRRDYSLAEIARITESENAIILSSFVESIGDGSLLQVTLKVNHEFSNGIIGGFERFGYKIKGTFNEGEAVDTLRERYESLIKYLSV